jgi:hypothetical protein
MKNMNDVKIIIFHNEVYLSEQSKHYFEQKIKEWLGSWFLIFCGYMKQQLIERQNGA